MAGRCLQVDPPFVDFKDVKVGEVYKKAVKVTNVGNSSKRIFIKKPALKLFKFTGCRQTVFLASGLSVTGMLEFTPENEKEVSDCVQILIDDVETVRVPVQGFPRTCLLLMDSLLDFGCVVASSQVISKNHPIINEGSAPGVFQVQCDGVDPSLSLSPSSGVVASGATQWLKVELRTDKPRQIAEEIQVTLQNRSAVVLSIKAKVVEQCLEVLDLQGTPLSCLWFGPVYFGTFCVQKVVLRNNSPQACDWVCQLQDKAAGTEVETDLQKSTHATLVERIEKGSSTSADISDVLVCVPSEGRLGPYEKTTLIVRFSPVRKRKKRGCSASRQDYCLFLLFDCVGRNRGFTHRSGNSSVEVALVGSGLPVSLVPSPSHRFNFLSSLTGSSVDLLCVLHNRCPQLPVNFRFRKLAHFTAEPSAATIAPGQCQDVVLTFSARQQGHFKVLQKLDVLGPVVSRRDDRTTEDRTELKVCCFHTITLHLYASCHSKMTHQIREVNAAVKNLDGIPTLPNDSTSAIRPASSHEKFRQQKKVENNVDIGIIPCHGLVPPTLTINDLARSNNSKTNSEYLSCSQVTTPITKNIIQVSEVINAFPSTTQEVADCSKILTAKESLQIVIEPLFVDFGCVCVQSVCVQTLTLINHLSKYVWVQLDVDYPELQVSSPLSHVLPPFSYHTLPLTFQSNKLGHFYRSLSYSINKQHPGQVVVEAQVVPLALELSTNLLVLYPTPAMFLQSEYRSSVTLRNQCNRAAEFTWNPVVTENGNVFTVRPATGVVEPYRELDCEVAWHPSFSSPSEDDFNLCVHDGNTQRLHCVAKVAATTVELIEKQIMFGSVPLNIPSVRTAVLHNTGQNHAYFQIPDVCPLPGMVVSPSEGTVPSKGQAMIKIHFNPDVVKQFNTRVEIMLRNMKSIELRVGGSVEIPNVEISVCRFQFCGVHVGSQEFITFALTNHSSATARVTFDLSKYEDFSIHLRQGSATLYAPLEMSPSILQFHVDPQLNICTKTVALKAEDEEGVCCRDLIAEAECVYWWFDCSKENVPTQSRTEPELCALTPSSGSLGPGQSTCVVVTINPKAITTGCELEEKEFWSELDEVMQSIPRGERVAIGADIDGDVGGAGNKGDEEVMGSGTSISAEVDEVKMENGTKIQPISVTFPDGSANHVTEASVTTLLCNVSFCSEVPLSLCTSITFTDHMHNRFKVQLCAITENCLLTVWPYVALHHSDQQIVIKTGVTAVEAILRSCNTLNPASGPTPFSSSFDFNRSTSKSSAASDSCPDGDSTSEQASRDMCPNRDTQTKLCTPHFPAANTEEGQFYQNVLLAVERWFSLFGWPSGPHPIKIPYTLRRAVSNINTPKYSSGRVSQNIDTRSVVDMLHHLTGKKIPGIRLCQSFSSDITQRTNQLLQQHEAMLAFLRVQGAFLCHVRPEYLLDLLEFKHWCSLQSNNKTDGLDYGTIDYESLSKRSWTDVLLQIYKVLVLCRVSERTLNGALNPKGSEGVVLNGLQSLASNIYSSQELQLLSWLSTHYQSMRRTVWGTGEVPSARWIVNFDLDLTDGLVLACLLAAYCPFLIRSHFWRMYTTTKSLEQIFHNNVIVAQALTSLHLNIGMQPTDLFDPNPVQMLILCVHLYEMLPQYLPLRTITLSGALHSTFSKEVRLKNPSPRPVKYQAFLLGDDTHFFTFPNGSSVTIPPRSSAELTVQFSCFHLHPMEATLLILSSASGFRRTILAFNLKTHISHITPTNTVKYSSPCYQLKVIQVPIINTLNKEADFRVVLVESTINPLETEMESLLQQGSSNCGLFLLSLHSIKEMASDMIGGRKNKDGNGEFLSRATSVCLKPGQADTLSILYLPFFLGTKYCAVLLVCPQVGDMVFMVKATSELPPPSPLTARPSCNSISFRKNSVKDKAARVPALTLHCKVGEVCKVVLQVPRINMLWEQALATWGQHCMSTNEYRRRMVTHTLRSSTVRSTIAAQKLLRQQLLKNIYQNKAIEYNVEVSLPHYFTLPSTVTVPIKEDTSISWEDPADCDVVDIPLRFRADSVGHFTCEVILRSCCDIRVHLLEAKVTSQGKLSLHNECDGTQHMFTFQGLRTSPLPVDHVVLHCPVGRTTHTQLDVPNYSQNNLTLKMVTNLSILSGIPSLEIKHGTNCPYSLAISPWIRGRCKGMVSFVERGDMQESVKDEEKVFGHYEVHISLEIICEPAAPLKVIDVQCTAQSAVAVEIPVSNPGKDLLILNVHLEGDDLTGANWISVPPRESLTYKATFSPVGVGKSTGSILFQSEKVGEFWYQLELYSLPPLVTTLPQVCCQLGKWVRLNIPLVNPMAEPLELIVANTNPRNYTLERTSASIFTVDPQSFTHLGVRFSPSTVGEGDHQGKIIFRCSQFQEWCILLSGCGFKPDGKEPLCISSMTGSSSSITIPFTNPTEFPVTLAFKLTDEDPRGPLTCHPDTDEKAFAIPLRPTEGLQIRASATIDVPVVFTANSMELQQAWLSITMKPILDSNISPRLEEELPNMCWIYSICGIPIEGPAENFPLDVVQCEAGGQLEKDVDVYLTGHTLDQGVTLVRMEDFLCEVRSDREAESSVEEAEEDCLSSSVEAARKDPENGIVILTLHLVFTPLKTCRCANIIVVTSAAGHIWEFPIILIATKPHVDDVILIKTTKLGQTSAVCFYLTSTTRKSKPFTTGFLPGGSSEFTVTPASGMLPPAGTPGVRITVTFTPTTSCKRHRARLVIQAADMQWTYVVRGKTPHTSPLLDNSPSEDRSSVSGPSEDLHHNFE
ncbi:cilia and flagella-associated protein 47-like [Xenentodon cancila]